MYVQQSVDRHSTIYTYDTSIVVPRGGGDPATPMYIIVPALVRGEGKSVKFLPISRRLL